MDVFDILVRYYPAFLKGLIVSMQLAGIIWAVGIVFGSLVGILSNRFRLVVGIPARTMSFLLSGVPVLVFLFWLHYPAQAVLNIVVDPFITAAATLCIVNVFAVSDLIRAVLDDFPRQYITAAKVTGLSKLQTVWRIQIPLIFRQVLPGLLMIQVSMLHMTLFASLISVEEIFRVAQRINAQIYKPVEI